MEIYKSVRLCLIVLALFWSCTIVSAKEVSAPSRLTITVEPSSVDEKEVLEIVRSVYDMPSRTFICEWNSKKIKDDFARRFEPYFSGNIIERFFKRKESCEMVASARYGFIPLDDPSLWDDRQFVLVNISQPEVVNNKATVEVRFWIRIETDSDPLDQDHGGTIVYLEHQLGKWKIVNFEGVDMLGAQGFQQLIDTYPSVAAPEWKDMNYQKSLKRPVRN